VFYEKMNVYAIVGIGLVDALGQSRSENWKKYILGKTAVRPIYNFNLNDYPIIKVTHAAEVNIDDIIVNEHIPDNERRNLDRYSLIGFSATVEALKECNIVNAQNTALIFSSLGGSQITTLNCTKNLLANKRSTPRQCLAAQRDSLVSLISRKFGFNGVTLNITSACASGIISLDYATKLLQDDDYDQVVVGGCDVMVDPLDIYMFQSIGALDTRTIPESSPFDINRNGFIMGEGAAVFVIKKLEKALSDGDKILSIIKGIGFASEAYHDTAVHPDGIGGRMSIDMALKKANLKRTDIDLIGAHATSTPNGDEIEYNILAEYFPNKPVMALKANIGHTMAACSLVELAYMIESMNNSTIGPIPTLQNSLGEEINLPKEKIHSTFDIGLKTSFGFGGKSAAIIVEKYNAS